MRDDVTAVPFETVNCTAWLFMRGHEEVAQVMGLRRAEWGTTEKHIWNNPPRDSDSNLFLPPGQESLCWRQQTLKLYDTFSPMLYRYLRSLGLPMDAVEDVVQESFFRLARHLKHGGGGDNLRSWIFQVAHNLSMDIHRAIRRSHSEVCLDQETQEEPVDPNANPERIYLQKEQTKRLRAAMLRLTPQQHSSILLRAEGLRYREIAEALGVSEQRAIHLVKRGLQRLAGGQ